MQILLFALYGRLYLSFHLIQIWSDKQEEEALTSAPSLIQTNSVKFLSDILFSPIARVTHFYSKSIIHFISNINSLKIIFAHSEILSFTYNKHTTFLMN